MVYMKKLFLAVVLLLMAQPIFALSASIQPPKMILSGEAPGSVSGSVNVMNPNNESITVNINVTGGIIGMVQLSNESLLLDSNETQKIDFTIAFIEEGNYVGELLFFFTPEQGQGVALSSQIIVIAESGETTTTTVPGTTMDDNWTLLGMLLGIIVIVAVILLYFWGRKR